MHILYVLFYDCFSYIRKALLHSLLHIYVHEICHIHTIYNTYMSYICIIRDMGVTLAHKDQSFSEVYQ